MCLFTREFFRIDYSVVRRTKQRKQKEKTERRNASQSKHSTVNRKNLANVRVMQRNLVYVIGLPVHYADEEVRCILPALLSINLRELTPICTRKRLFRHCDLWIALDNMVKSSRL